MHACVCVCVGGGGAQATYEGAHRDQTMAPGLLELQLQAIVSCCVGAGNQTLEEQPLLLSTQPFSTSLVLYFLSLHGILNSILSTKKFLL